MSMTINLVEDHNIYLCEGGPVYNGGVQPTPPPITYLTQWKIVGNSEVHGQEIWSCGEYNATDGKYHILVQPLGGSIADIALAEPLRKVNDVADKIEFSNGSAIVTRNLKSLASLTYQIWWKMQQIGTSGTYRIRGAGVKDIKVGGISNFLTAIYTTVSPNDTYLKKDGISLDNNGALLIYDSNYNTKDSLNDFKAHIRNVELIYELKTPTTELIDAPQIEEAESYSMVISQGGKAVSWSEFLYTINYLLTDSENNLLVDSENYQLTVQN